MLLSFLERLLYRIISPATIAYLLLLAGMFASVMYFVFALVPKSHYLWKSNIPFTEDILVNKYLGKIAKEKDIVIENPSEDIIIRSTDEKFNILYTILPETDNIYLFTNETTSATFPVLSLTRTVGSRGYNIILPIAKITVKPDIIPFNEKKDDLVWRGSNSGGKSRVGIERWTSTFDVGFTSAKSKRYLGSTDLRLHIKDKMSTEDKLKYKYILMLESKTVPQGLKQILASNSVCFMPSPTIESYLLESELIPWTHYIPVWRDLQDLSDRVTWARKNEKKVLEIIKNANKYVNKLDELLSGTNVIRRVLFHYSRDVIIKDEKNAKIIDKVDVD